MKKLFLVLTLVLALLFPAAVLAGECVLPDGSTAHLYNPMAGVFLFEESIVPGDQTVEVNSTQLDANWLKSFGESIGKDWSDGVIIIDHDDRVVALVHKSDLSGCE